MSDLRRTLHSAYAFIRSVEVNKATASLTLDHLLQEQISKLKKGDTRSILDSKGESLGNRIAYLDTLDALSEELKNVVQAVKDAVSDPEKLKALGIFEVDEEAANQT